MITPLAASVPYSVAADGPFTTSIDSISSGFRSVIAPAVHPELYCLGPIRLPPPLVFSTRTPSMIMRGELSWDRLLKPRMRIRAAEPVMPALLKVITPATRPCSRSVTFVMGAVATMESAPIVPITFAMLSFCCSPVAVTTIPLRLTGALVRAKSRLTAAPSATVTSWEASE